MSRKATNPPHTKRQNPNSAQKPDTSPSAQAHATPSAPNAKPPAAKAPQGAEGLLPLFDQPAAASTSHEEARQSKAIAEAFIAAQGTELERLSRIMDLLPCYVALINAEYRVVYHNKAYTQYFGEPGLRPCYSAMRCQETSCRFCQVPDTAAGKDSSSVMEWIHPETRHAFRVYAYAFVDVDSTRCVLETGFNITSAMRVQQALDLSEQSYRVITDNLSIGIALVDPELRIKTGNTRMGLWFSGGFRLNGRVCELLRCGNEWEKALAEENFFCSDCPFKASLEDGSGHEKELTVFFQDGREHAVRLVTCPVIPAKGKTTSKVRAFILMLEDITNRIQVNKQLQRARKLEALTTLAGGIAHEINQPLSALHLYAGGLQMLLEKSDDLPQETMMERLGLIMREADKIRSIITHMRALVMKEGAVRLGPVMLDSSLEAVNELMQTRLSQRGIVLEIDVPHSLPPVRASRTQMEQVLVNLIGNALHALEQEERTDKRIRVTARLTPETNRVRLSVQDNGPGLADGAEHIFDPFFTTKEKHEGMGLGLSIVHGFVTMWGATIGVTAKGGELGGAVFMIDLQVATPDNADAPTTAAAEHDAPGPLVKALDDIEKSLPGEQEKA